MKRKSLAALAALAMLCLTVQPAAANHDPKNSAFLEAIPASHSLYAEEVSVSAHAAAVIDVQTGRVLYEKNGDEKMLIASLTKIITAIVAIESGVDLNSTVTVSSRASGKEGSSIYLKVGEKQKLIDLLYAVMLRSGNDAATAVAEHVGKTEQGFVELMNQKVAELGLTQTHFANPHGLDAQEHYSSAHDMAVLTAYALRNPVFAEIVKTKVKSIPMPGEAWDRKMYNKNKMLTRYDGADGVKTGYTKAAGRCLASSATKDGRQIAVLTLDASSDWDDHARLLNYGFEKYKFMPVVKEHDVLQTVPVEDGMKQEVDVVVGHEFNFPLREEEQEKLTRKVELEDSLDAPIAAGQKVGEMKFYFEERLVGEVPILAGHDVQEKSFWEKVKGLFTSMISR
ncbi:D-alanyl-D-alanine carboxypeptidase [Tumebacillus sp. BK434]|uniref:D-alanyl-D-alanine carboxypeptidase family protein n=1 Tax=Tumebacillus sp. BK434 TaxID=2512169 RepID=UPI001054000A|nr:D-alanyl-D-alanine carboxypeptidase family protein [Tumebacillus sp. BK434]TCP59521.1 D-alanyl-D-alanine carboxypeptidase [Tumebacillus sp. BK434]